MHTQSHKKRPSGTNRARAAPTVSILHVRLSLLPSVLKSQNNNIVSQCFNRNIIVNRLARKYFAKLTLYKMSPPPRDPNINFWVKRTPRALRLLFRTHKSTAHNITIFSLPIIGTYYYYYYVLRGWTVL